MGDSFDCGSARMREDSAVFQTSTQIIGPNSPTTLTFHGMENRTQVVTSSAVVLNADGTPRLNPDGTPVKAFADQTITLDPNGADLPWEKDVTLPQWNGTLADGTTLPDGQYQLDFWITDGDGNPSPDVKTGFTIDTTLPSSAAISAVRSRAHWYAAPFTFHHAFQVRAVGTRLPFEAARNWA